MKIKKNIKKGIIILTLCIVGVFYVYNHPTLISKTEYNKMIQTNEIISATIKEKTSDLNDVIIKTKNHETFKIVLDNKETQKLSAKVNVEFPLFNSFQTAVLGMGFLSLVTYAGLKYIQFVALLHHKEMVMDNISNVTMNTMNEPKKNMGKNIHSTVTMSDVAGCDEEKQEVLEVIDFLKHPKKYENMGATIPKGVLLMGPPGTGKTLLAQAIAGESGVNFLYASGSEFIEKFVGVGASRVRELFETAQKQAPAILFIDEIDAIGRQRGMDNNAEADQTLNQLLVEMDGIKKNSSIIVIGATNRPEVLDKAFLRKGRFDRQIAINLPTTQGREDILMVHSKNKKLAKDVNLKEIAKNTSGFSGADLKALLNEAALSAVRSKHTNIEISDTEEAIDRVIMGHASKKTRSKKDLEIVSYHECGHTIIGLKMSNADKIHKVTIVPRGDAGGYTMLAPQEDKMLYSKVDLAEKICGLLGGRAAEEIKYGKDHITTGASNDLQRATNIARSMVTEYGMTSAGLCQYELVKKSYAGDRQTTSNISEATSQAIDDMVNTIIQKCYDYSLQILNENRLLLDDMANVLLEKEILNSNEIENLEKKYM